MGLMDEIRKERTRKGPACSVKIVRLQMSEEDRLDLDVALGDLSVTGAAISRVLMRRGHRVSADSICRHRNGECICDE